MRPLLAIAPMKTTANGSRRTDVEIYTEKIEAAADFEDLCNIIEEAADDGWITNEDYCRVYDACVNRARNL